LPLRAGAGLTAFLGAESQIENPAESSGEARVVALAVEETVEPPVEAEG